MPDNSQDHRNLPPSKDDEPTPRLDNFETETKAKEAHALLKSDVFLDAMEEVYSKAVGTLLDADIGSLTAQGAHAIMKAVIEIRGQLEEYVNDDKVRKKYNKGDK